MIYMIYRLYHIYICICIYIYRYIIYHIYHICIYAYIYAYIDFKRHLVSERLASGLKAGFRLGSRLLDFKAVGFKRLAPEGCITYSHTSLNMRGGQAD